MQNRMATDRKSRLNFPVQDYKTITCPNCGSHRVKTTKSEPVGDTVRQRLHSCPNCPARFASLETVPTIDRLKDLEAEAAMRAEILANNDPH